MDHLVHFLFMALTKQEKGNLIDQASKNLQASKAAVFAEFNGVFTEDFKRLRRELRKVGADFKIVKKRLLNIALQKSGIAFNPASAKTQLGTIFSKEELTNLAGLVYKFSKDIVKAKKGQFTVLGAYDAIEKRLVGISEFKVIATLPSREVLLAQIAMMLTIPLKQMMKVLEERSKKCK